MRPASTELTTKGSPNFEGIGNGNGNGNGNPSDVLNGNGNTAATGNGNGTYCARLASADT